MTQISHSKALLSPREACLIIFGTDSRSKVNQLRAMLRGGAIKGRRMFGRWYISVAEIERITDGAADFSNYTEK